MVKKIVTILLILIFSLGITTIPSYAKSDFDIIDEFMNSDVVFDTFSELGAVVESEDGINTFMKVLEVYPFWIEQIQAIEADMPYSFTSTGSEKIDESIVKDVLEKQVIFDDFTKLLEAERTADSGKILMCVLEIYPDFVEGFVASIQAHSNAGFQIGTILSNGGTEIVCIIVGIVIGFFGAWLIFRKKNTDAISSSTADEK